MYFKTIEWVRLKNLENATVKANSFILLSGYIKPVKTDWFNATIGSLIGAGLLPEMHLLLHLKNILWLVLSLWFYLIPASWLSVFVNLFFKFYRFRFKMV